MRRTSLAFLLFLLAAIVSGCHLPAATRSAPVLTGSEKRTPLLQARDDFGYLVSLRRPPQRIVCLAPNAAEIAFALGLGRQVVGVSQFSDYPPEARKKPLVGRYDRPNIEKIISLQPDLAIFGYGNPKELAQTLKDAGVPVFGVNPKTIGEIMGVIQRIGLLCGAEARANQVTADMRARLKKIEQRLALEKPRGLRAFIVIDEEFLWTAGANTLQDEILRLAGGENIASSRPSFYPMSKEALLQAQPDLILVAGKTSQAQAIRRRLARRADLAQLRAVKEGRIVVIDGDTFSRPGPRVVKAVEQLFGILSDISSKSAQTSNQPAK